MEILQNDIFGRKHKTVKEKEIKQPLDPVRKSYRNVTIFDGLDEAALSYDSMLIHRILQRKILYHRNLNQKQKEQFLRIIINEMNIKSGKVDPITSTRDSLLSFFL
jgi:hypothetical protein